MKTQENPRTVFTTSNYKILEGPGIEIRTVYYDHMRKHGHEITIHDGKGGYGWGNKLFEGTIEELIERLVGCQLEVAGENTMCRQCWLEHGQDGQSCHVGCGCHDGCTASLEGEEKEEE